MPISVVIVIWLVATGSYGDSLDIEEWIREQTTGWDETDDAVESLWSLEAWQIDPGRAVVDELRMLPGMNYNTVRLINDRNKDIPSIKEKLTPTQRIGLWMPDSQVKAKVNLRADRRFGRGADRDIKRYDGSAEGLTQRYRVEWSYWSTGLMFDKDKYEPRIDDLTRFWGAYREGDSEVIAGDFRVTGGLGVALGKTPTYFGLFPTSSVYMKTEPRISPATDTQVNSALRGVAILQRFSGFTGAIFGADTRYDAILSSDGRIERLSDGGLHRSSGEVRKMNSLRERSFGGGVNYEIPKDFPVGFSVGISGWQGYYSPPFEPTPSVRIPDPIVGSELSVIGVNSGIEYDGVRVMYEYAIDRDRFPAKVLAFRVDGKILPGTIRGVWFDFPLDFTNPNGVCPIGDRAENLKGVAIVYNYKFKGNLVNKVTFYGQATSTPARTYTVTEPADEQRWSMEVSSRKGRWGQGDLRLRQQWDVIGHGEANPSENARRDRCRYIHNLYPVNRWINNFRMGIEGGYRQTTYSPTHSTGWTAFSRVIIRVFESRIRTRNSILLKIGGAYFETQTQLPFYLLESDMPDRISTVRLSGTGYRWYATLQNSFANHELALRAAQTIGRGVEKGDLECYITYSYEY